MNINLSKKSLHFQIVTRYGLGDFDDVPTDMCTYIRKFFRGLVIIALITAILGLLLGVVGGHLVAWLSWMLLIVSTKVRVICARIIR